jgi:Sel1 repeat
MKFICPLILIIICSCSQSKTIGKKTTADDDNNVVIVNSKNTTHNSTGNGKTIFEGKNNLIEVSYDSSNYQGKNINSTTIIRGSQNNIQIKQNKVTSYAENTNDTFIIAGNKQKIELSGSNITDTEKDKSDKTVLAKKSTKDDLNSVTAIRDESSNTPAFIFEVKNLEEDSLTYFSDTVLIVIEEKDEPIKIRDAINFYFNEIKNGNARGYYKIGLFFQTGIGTKVNSLKTEEYFEIAARKGIAEAQFSLGYIYEAGFWKIQPNKEKAIYYYKLAAAQGNKDAQERLDEIVR